MINTSNPFNQLNNLYKKVPMLPAEVTQTKHLTPEDKTLLQRIGLTAGQVKRDLLKDIQIQYDRYSLYQQIERALEHPIVGAATELYANYCCLTGDTRIPLLDGRTLTIKEILQEQEAGKENWVYSCDYAGKPQPSKILHAVKQKHTPKTFRVWLDNGKYVDASDNHKFIKRDGSLCRVDELKINDSLMPFHRSQTKNGYELVWDVPKKNWTATYRMVAEYCSGIDLKKANKGKSVADDICLVVHHKWDEEKRTFDKSNNSPTMLEVLSSVEHRAIHNKVLVERWNNPEARKLQSQKMIALNQDPAFRKANKEAHNTSKYKEKMQPYWDKQTGNKERGKKISVGRTAYWASLSIKQRRRIPREIRVCQDPDCSNTFECKVNSSQKYCVSGHANKGNRYSSSKKGRLTAPREIRICAHLDCTNAFEVKISSTKQHCSSVCSNSNPEINKKRSESISRAKTLVPSYNHKIVKIEYIGEQVVYDIEVSGSHLFGLDIGIYISNTVFSTMHNGTVWITSESPTYQRELTKLLDSISIEEKIFDWAYTTGSYGDMFVKINGVPGKGIVSINDEEHPLNISRVDHEGILVGYYKTPMGTSGDIQHLLAPWEYSHFRLLGGKKKRPQFGQQQSNSSYRSTHLLTGMDTKQITTKYGTSLILNALPSYKRLRLAEDSLLLARLSRGLIRYIWKLKVNSCLQGDTQISLMDGTDPTIKEMAENLEEYIGKYVLTVNEETKNLEPKQIKNVQKTRKNAQLVRVHLDNEKYVDCTPDHRFMMRDGSYVEAQYLKLNDSLMPFYTRISEKEKDIIDGYRLVYDPETGKYRREHRIAVGKLRKGQIPHHVDYNKQNNDPSNFRIFESQSEHCKFHHEHSEKYGWAIAGSRPKTKEHSQKIVDSRRAKGKPWHSVDTKSIMKKARQEGFASGRITPSMTGRHHSKESKEKNKQSHIGITKEMNPNLVRSKESKDKIRGTNHPNWVPVETRICKCGCEEAFECKINSKQRFIYAHHNRGSFNPNARKKAQLIECLLNHKVARVEWLNEREDTYDLEIDGTPNFPLTNGIFVHNSNMEAVGELVDQYSRVLREARALDTREGSPSFESRENPMSVIEDIFLPVWDDTGDLTFDKIGGEADIRWIRDIEDLRQQLAAALRTPLPLLGAYLKEATGPLGSDAIEKLDINFARMARKLQRAVRNGVKRICQIHLAYMNMDPDPQLFDVQMPEMSTAEEESLKASLKDGMDTIDSFMNIVDRVTEDDNRKIDKIEVFQFLNEKFLKLEDFDLKDFVIDSGKEPIGECVRRKQRMDTQLKLQKIFEKEIKEDKERLFPKNPIFDSDLMSYFPTTTHKIMEGKSIINKRAVSKLTRRGGWLGIERGKEVWESKFGECLVSSCMEGDEEKKLVATGQLELPFK